ncbi:hypothetical protein C2G38_2046987 [Gigaspora rosea]|uniref:Uncharacterized protein n=1 Tax=Gigaspora rosea TaxID=44941 RepID=A0A397UFW1_9GLOM|nr:hypothetical protein C2G38_2046987 [Gigaspora rosea]
MSHNVTVIDCGSAMKNHRKKAFSSYKKIPQINKIFGINANSIEELSKLNPLPIDKANEVERSVYVAAVLHGILSAIDSSEKIKLHRECSLSDANGKGRFDFTIVQDENISVLLSLTTKRKHENLEYVYGIVTTGEKWFFTVVTSNDDIGVTSAPICINLNPDANEEILKVLKNHDQNIKG